MLFKRRGVEDRPAREMLRFRSAKNDIDFSYLTTNVSDVNSALASP